LSERVGLQILYVVHSLMIGNISLNWQDKTCNRLFPAIGET